MAQGGTTNSRLEAVELLGTMRLDPQISAGRRDVGVDDQLIGSVGPVRDNRDVTQTGIQDRLGDGEQVRAGSSAFAQQNMVTTPPGADGDS